MRYDVAVVGAGPVGSVAARHAALHGAKVALLEEHATVGSPVQCAGLLSVRAMDECDISPTDPSVINSVRGAFVHSPGGTCLPVDGGRTRAFVVSRKMFDRKLAALATSEGVHIFLNSKVVAIDNNSGFKRLHVQRAGKSEMIEASVVIGADGVRHGVASMVGLPAPSRIMSGIQFEVQMETIRQDFVELFVGACAPGFFAWAIPLSDGTVRLGLATDNLESRDSLSYLCELKRNLSKVGRAVDGMLDFVVGGIPIGVADRTFSDGVLICGDAAGQVKPTSGGGVYTGAVCAKIAGEVAAKAAFEKNTSKSRLEEYEIRWKQALGKELNLGMKAHDFVGNLSDEQFNELFSSLTEPNVISLIEKYGDMDQPSILLRKFLNPLNSRHLKGFFVVFLKTLL
ncbi:NAD(P)/FAD-dependent oxidoreductase [Methanohalophilus mahii]|uniref:Geranylgeranyl reductase n=1 Tax=Methanohalophilus mahii (strain ATCC 35705 / DSM 5219 / SLP) TaxID=547558 RepID=D5EAA4_METMS|nr:NAD(P)/FAD-dependent oxidoreductase [Methanohalophilus mahii]ADE36105.1 geranylgeranyl reductase [Methanohalophilus mahii DSM 5219]